MPEEHLRFFDERLRQKLVNFFMSRRLSVSDAEDLTHQVFLRLVRFLTKLYEERGEVISLKALAFNVARYIYMEEIRHARRQIPFSSLSLPEMEVVANFRAPATTPEEQEEHRIRTSSYEEAMAELSPEEREFLFDYYPNVADPVKLTKLRKELAARLGITEKAMRVRLSRLRERLRRSIEEKIYRKHGNRLVR